MPDIVVEGQKIIVPTKQSDETVYTGTEITREGMDIAGEKGKASVYEVVSVVPGVVFEGVDPNNLASEQSSIRVRGVKGYLGAMTVEGVPNYGGNPMGPRNYIYDLDNFESISIYKGAIPSDLGSGVGNRAGAIELKPLWATKDFGVKFSQSLGSFDYKRTFFRLDSGEKGPLTTRISLAYSFSEADKWKGPGDIGPRNNFNFTLVQPLGEKLEIKFWANYNYIENYKYKSLTYDQAENLDKYYRLDFNESFTGNPSEDYLYYKYNWEKHENKDYLSVLTLQATDYLKFIFKPYLSQEDARIKTGYSKLQGKPGVQQRNRDIERKGIISEAEVEFKNIIASLGYHYEVADMDITAENYWINSDGSLTYRGYGIFSTTGDTYVHSPYLKVAGNGDKLNWQAGVKYFRFEDSASKGYVTQYSGGVPTLVRAPDLDRKARTYDIWLPTAGVSYKFSDNWESSVSYGKNFIRPYAYMPLISLYNRLRTQFQAAGITLNDLFDGYDIEESDNFDFGIKYHNSYLEINPTLFFSRHKKLLTKISDSRVLDSGKPVTYYQNIGKAKGYGLELPMNFFLSDKFTFYLNPTYNSLTYDRDIEYQGQTYDTKGKQIVDVPKWTVVSGIIFKHQGWEISPQMRYIGKRYGDIEHKEDIPSYEVFDFKASYTKKNIGAFKEFKVFLELNNLFDRHYVSSISAWDDTVSGASYYVGAPFSLKAGLSFKF